LVTRLSDVATGWRPMLSYREAGELTTLAAML
jgi:hypothetical protein